VEGEEKSSLRRGRGDETVGVSASGGIASALSVVWTKDQRSRYSGKKYGACFITFQYVFGKEEGGILTGEREGGGGAGIGRGGGGGGGGGGGEGRKEGRHAPTPVSADTEKKVCRVGRVSGAMRGRV